MKKTPFKLDRKKRIAFSGFVLPLTLVICIIILTISAGISIILAKQLYFSRLERQSHLAYYAADNGLTCALMVDDHYLDTSTGIGIFEYGGPSPQTVLDGVNTWRAIRGYAPIQLTDIRCATSPVFDPSAEYAVTDYSHSLPGGGTEAGKTTTFSMRMDLGDGAFRCARIIVNKTPTYRQIISRGFVSCDTTGQIPVERAIVNTSDR